MVGVPREVLVDDAKRLIAAHSGLDAVVAAFVFGSVAWGDASQGSVFSVVDSLLHAAFIAEGAGTTAREDAIFGVLSGASHLVAVLLAFFLGGLLVGRIVPAFPGSNGAASACLGALAILAYLAGPLIPWIWEPISNPGEVYTRAENLNNLLVVGVGFSVALPFVALSGYLGGLLGGRIRGRFAARGTAS